MRKQYERTAEKSVAMDVRLPKLHIKMNKEKTAVFSKEARLTTSQVKGLSVWTHNQTVTVEIYNVSGGEQESCSV